MKTTDENHIKILFRFYNDVLEEETVETVWATIVDKNKGLYKIDNIPFYVPSIASADIVFAEYDEQEKMFTYRETIEYSGNSTVQVVIMDKKIKINNLRALFKKHGCTSERLNDAYFVMEIPANVDYKKIKIKLDKLEQQEKIEYAEPCLSDRHIKNMTI